MFKKKIEELKELQKKRNQSLYGVEKTPKGIEEKILKIIKYLFWGCPVIDGVDYTLKKGWLFVRANYALDEIRAKELGFKPHKDGYVKKIIAIQK